MPAAESAAPISLESGAPIERTEPAAESQLGDSEKSSTTYLLRLTFVAGIGGVLFGFDTGVISGVLVAIGDSLGGVELTATQQEVVVSATTFGALFSSLAAGRLADGYGRKPVLCWSAVLFAVSAVWQALAQSFGSLTGGRLLAGVGVGLASMVVPAYLGEVAPEQHRGKIVVADIALVTGGQVLAYIVDSLLFDVKNGWRWMAAFGAIPPIIQLFGLLTLPESPRYLILSSRRQDAQDVLSLIYPYATRTDLVDKVEAVEDSLRAEGAGEGKKEDLRELLGKIWFVRHNRRALIVAVGLQLLQQVTGFNTLMYYSATILELAGFSSNPTRAALCVAFANFICTCIALRLIDRLGRRPMLLFSLAGMVVGLVALALSFKLLSDHISESDATPPANAWASYFCLFSMIAFCSTYAFGMGPLPWLMQAELFSTEVRGLGGGIASAACWLGNLLVSATFLSLVKGISASGAFWLYAALAAAGIAFVFLRVPETAGVPLEEIPALFDSDDVRTRRPSRAPLVASPSSRGTYAQLARDE